MPPFATSSCRAPSARRLLRGIPRVRPFPSEPASLALRDYIRRKFHGRSIDLVIANTTPALPFVLHRDDLFPARRSSFAGRVPERPAAPVAEYGRAERSRCGNAKLALRLHPSAKRVFVVAQVDCQDDDTVRAQLRDFSRAGPAHLYQEKTLPRVLRGEAVLPAALILHSRYIPAERQSVSGRGRTTRGRGLASAYLRRHDLNIGTGIVGGMMRGTRDRDAPRRNRAADSRRHASGGHSDRRGAGRADLRLAPAAALGHRPVAVARGVGHPIQAADGVGILSLVHHRDAARRRRAVGAHRGAADAESPDGVAPRPRFEPATNGFGTWPGG